MIVQAETVTMGQISLGNLKAYEMLFRQYYQMLCSYSLKFVSDPDVAEEIVQDLFYTLWEKSELQWIFRNHYPAHKHY